MAMAMELNFFSEVKDSNALIKEFIKSILYMHCQCPRPFDDLKDENLEYMLNGETEYSRGTNRPQMRRIRRFLTEVEDLFSHIHHFILHLSTVRSVLLLIGNSFLKPKEAYRLVFHGQHSDSKSSSEKDAPVTESSVSNLKKFSRELALSDLPFQARTAMKLYVFFQVNKINEEIPFFFPKIGFAPIFHRVNVVTIHLSESILKNQVRSIQDFEDGLIWYQCCKTVKGILSKQTG